jgi:hypothetical protein
MTFNPSSLDLKKLFVDPAMFDSPDAFRAAGFDASNRSRDLIMVGSHKEAEGYLFKKYRNRISLKDQRDNYARRIEGVQKLSAFIAERHFRHIAAPQKWLYKLPSEFSREDSSTSRWTHSGQQAAWSHGYSSHKRSSYVLVVERLTILDEEASMREYQHIDEDVLRELCMTLVKFRGLDSTARNMAFTENGRIAFVDTENWNRRKKSWLRYIGPLLPRRRRKLAEEIFDKFGDR